VKNLEVGDFRLVSCFEKDLEPGLNVVWSRPARVAPMPRAQAMAMERAWPDGFC
jgi:hypothetical protein